MAVSTASTILKHKVADGFVKLVDIKEYPDMGGEPEKIETTDLSATKYKTNILGLQDSPDLTFTANYTPEAYAKLDEITEENDYQLVLGVDGVHGTFEWTGDLSVFLGGGGVDDVREMTISMNATGEITFTQ